MGLALLIAAVTGGAVGYLAPHPAPQVCVDAVAGARMMLNDYAAFAQSSLRGIAASLVGVSYDPNTDPTYKKIVANAPELKEKMDACR